MTCITQINYINEIPVIELPSPTRRERLARTIRGLVTGGVILRDEWHAFRNDPDINTRHFGKSLHATCPGKARYILVRPVLYDCLSYNTVLIQLSAARLIPTDLPRFTMLKRRADEILVKYQQTVTRVYCLGQSSVWRPRSVGNFDDAIVYFNLDPQDRGFRLHYTRHPFLPSDWILAHQHIN